MSARDKLVEEEEVVDTESEEETEVEVETDDEEVEIEAPSPLELLGKVVDSQIVDDDEAGKAAFHDYLQGTMKNVLSPETTEVDLDVEDSEELESSEEETTDEVTDEVTED